MIIYSIDSDWNYDHLASFALQPIPSLNILSAYTGSVILFGNQMPLSYMRVEIKLTKKGIGKVKKAERIDMENGGFLSNKFKVHYYSR